ncbi:hypothetical protein llap_9806 [Limosa lapponica baueri]|uniref:Uncharacterized protein n=1 Tax=Limosa lapponica baueri TaxID=1758121 RepID=A0A2I0U1E9_LIMLA|nr:hypothetical protein llap_9806 [Limosa lapponica baueri]
MHRKIHSPTEAIRVLINTIKGTTKKMDHSHLPLVKAYYCTHLTLLLHTEPFKDSYEDHSLFHGIKEDAHFPNDKK